MDKKKLINANILGVAIMPVFIRNIRNFRYQSLIIAGIILNLIKAFTARSTPQVFVKIIS
jgi:hypothetical protein